jgi:hypothetical protein
MAVCEDHGIPGILSMRGSNEPAIVCPECRARLSGPP